MDAFVWALRNSVFEKYDVTHGGDVKLRVFAREWRWWPDDFVRIDSG